jgi:uncharacterized membrane protein AbrB (regulator of aidB expression)
VLAALNRSRARGSPLPLRSARPAAFWAENLGIPAGWIAGGLLIVAAASLAGLQTEVPHRLRPPINLVLGMLLRQRRVA